ncbi:hypothetical protein CC_2385 [Caulobacter vibrioides CB15]|uniref:Uncharacterized protein n=1 Tax=Caulobacter vibrioides (strain ATCC 19089 / CIP 103742 / CB 15) TaxID=190650 RepID=Q9A5R2_CAUVC|nr:hypothetical protein CC_2385 [Caulobacter vibrioides CB15]
MAVKELSQFRSARERLGLYRLKMAACILLQSGRRRSLSVGEFRRLGSGRRLPIGRVVSLECARNAVSRKKAWLTALRSGCLLSADLVKPS